ncbi:YcaO-like family protein [Viridibacillus sp. NPDC096237]|uniref:YcaO-like family protein n=1 Tax=Viridibacillus sp. NPDC096237 TaxID=3390721 RepID=UPI003CFCA3BB
MRCIKKDENTCIVIGAAAPQEVECSDSDLFSELFNIDLNDLNLSESTNINFNVVNNFKKELLGNTKSNDTSDFIYIDGERSLTTEEDIIYSEPSRKVLHIANCSINFIMNTFTNNKESNNIFIIELFDDILVTGTSRKEGTCLTCVLNRYIESRADILKFKDIKSLITNTQTSNELAFAVRALAKYKVLNNDSNITILNKSNLNITNAHLISMNGCHFCFKQTKNSFNDLKLGELGETSIGEYRTKENKSAVSILNKYVTPIGPVYNLNEYKNIDFLKTIIFEASSNSSDVEVGYNLHGGKGNDKDSAIISTIGEALERYNARRFETDSLIRGHFNELRQKNNVLHPNSLILDKNTPHEFQPDKKYDWVMCKNLSKSQDILVPAIAVFFPFHSIDESELFLSQSSSGLASGFSCAEAILSGLLEVIERDAYTIYHKNTMYYGTIAPSVYSAEVTSLIDYLNNNGITAILQYLKTDLPVHTVHCTLFDKMNRLPIYTHGSGCSLDINSAIKRAIVEACQLRVSQIELLNSENDIDIDVDADEFEAYLEWAKGNEDFVSPFIKHKKERIISGFDDYRQGSVVKNLNFLLSSINELGYEVIVANLEREDNQLNTVRVIIPGFQDIDDYGGRVSKRVEELPIILKLPVKSNINQMFS